MIPDSDDAERQRIEIANGYKCKKQTSVTSAFLEFGSSDWTRTSDIRINSPPFYRLNYRGIVVEAYLSGEKSFVKPDLRENRLIADSVDSLL